VGRGDGPGAKLYVFSRVCAILGSGCCREMIEVVEMPLWLSARRRGELSVTDKYEQLPEGMVGGSSGVLTMRWRASAAQILLFPVRVKGISTSHSY